MTRLKQQLRQAGGPAPGLDDTDRALIASIGKGLPLVSHPYAEIARDLGLDEQQVVDRLAALCRKGLVKRFGVVVRHHELGYRANAMVVWDVADEEVGALGRRFSAYDFVTLCYRRPRQRPHWPYNLFCMIHGKSRDQVQSCIARLRAECGLEAVEHRVLFSRRRFKQRGARYRVEGSSQLSPAGS